MKMTLQLLEKDRVRIRNLLDKEIKKGYKLVTDDFTGFDLKGFSEQIGTCISSVNTLSDELDTVLSNMSLTVQGPDETIMFEKQMDSDFAVMELDCDLNSTLGVMKRFVLSRVTQCKEPILSSNDFENICRAINRTGPLQVDEILTSYQNTENDFQIQQRGQVIGENDIQKPSIDKASNNLHADIHGTGVVFDFCESTQDIQVKSLLNTTDLKQNTNQHGNKQKSRHRKKKMRVVAVLESLSTGNNRSKCGKRRIVQPRQGNKVKTKKKKTKKEAAVLESLSTVNNGSKCKGWNKQSRRGYKVKIKNGRQSTSMKGHAKSCKERMPQHWRHDCFAQQNERYMTRRVRVKREP